MRVVRLAAFDVRAKRLRPRHGAGIALIHPAVPPRFLCGKAKVDAGVVLAAQKFDGDVVQPRQIPAKRLKAESSPAISACVAAGENSMKIMRWNIAASFAAFS